MCNVDAYASTNTYFHAYATNKFGKIASMKQICECERNVICLQQWARGKQNIKKTYPLEIQRK